MHLDRQGGTITELVDIAADVCKIERKYVEAVSQRRCGLEIPRGSGEASCFTDPCGRAAIARCCDCRTFICDEHYVIQPVDAEHAILCPVCASMLRR